MTIAHFKQQIANMLNRPLTSLTSVNAEDMVLMAMNDARMAAQRSHEFELNRTEDAYLSTHLGGANWMTGCKTTPGGGTAILMKRVDAVWNYSSYLVGATTYYPRTTRVPFDYSGRFNRELSIIDQRFNPNQASSVTTMDQFAYAVGNQLFVTTISTASIYKLVGVQFLDDLTGSESPDIFLTYFTDWFRYATVAALNVYLKDSERFPIDVNVLANLWQSVQTLDGTIANMGESVNLD